MPVPWTRESKHIPLIEQRAITIQQLRDLHVFIERLCKTRLLCTRDEQPQPLSIFDVNMYHIAELVIKPVITFEEERRGTGRQCSWVEFVAAEGAQTPDMMFSHSWAGRFQDFMAVVNKLERSRGFGGAAAIWVCTFANSQFGENFGAGLRDSPFYKAISTAQGVLLVVDRDASSLQRIWCGFELHVTMRMDKPLVIFTSMGQVGEEVNTGPLVEAVEAWDVRQMEASQEADRRQILNYLGGGEPQERRGLRSDEHGNLLLLDGWRKQLESRELASASKDDDDNSAPSRSNGQPEYAHEAGLFRSHAEAFQRLNLAVRTKVLQAAQAQPLSPGRSASALPLVQRGVTLGEMRTGVKRLRGLVAAAGGRLEDLTMKEVFHEHLSPCCPAGFSYAEALGGPRTPQYVIDEVWHSSFLGNISAIEWAAEALQLADSVVLYFTFFCVRPGEMLSDWDSDIKRIITSSYGWISVLPLDREHVIRSNRMQQLCICFEHARPIYLACEGGVLAGLKPFRSSSWEFGNFDPSIARILLDANWEEARCASKEVEERIRLEVRNLPGGFSGFKVRLTSAAAGPALRHAVQQQSPEGLREVEELCRLDGLKINSQLLKGALGETPLHIAAAVGNVRAMELLLAAKADPNSEDAVLETPLHYAAVAGEARATKCLLTHGAITQVESAFAETPLRVAQQNPAGFLGVDPSRVVALLEAWEAASEMPQD